MNKELYAEWKFTDSNDYPSWLEDRVIALKEELARQHLTCNSIPATPSPQGEITPCEYIGKCLDYENGSCNGNNGNCGKTA